MTLCANSLMAYFINRVGHDSLVAVHEVYEVYLPGVDVGLGMGRLHVSNSFWVSETIGQEQ